MGKEPLFPAKGVIYLITTGTYDDYATVGAASSYEKAKEFMDQFPDEEEFNEPEEVIIDNLFKIPEGKYPYFVRVGMEDYQIIDVQRLELNMFHSIEALRSNITKDYKGNYIIYLFAKTLEEASSLAVKKIKGE